jgi:hypothetical protein
MKRLFFLPMQTLKGAPAKGTTTSELIIIVMNIWNEAMDRFKQQNEITRQPIVSYDNPIIHKAATEKLESLRVSQKRDIAPLAEYSPDMHKVIEHLHSNRQKAFWLRLRGDASIKTPPQYVDLIFECFCSLGKESISRGVQSLIPTHQAIIEEEGDWPKNIIQMSCEAVNYWRLRGGPR